MVNVITTQVIALLLGALAFVTALAWNSLVQNVFKTYYKSDNNSLKGQAIYTLIVTLSSVLVAYFVLKFFQGYDPTAKLF